MRRGPLLALAIGCAGPPVVDGDDTDTDTDTDVVDTDGSVPLRARAGDDAVRRVGEALVLDGAGSEGVVEARWSFGDGSTTARGPLAPVEHAWSAPGHYRVTLEVFDADGQSATDTLDVTVTWPLAAAPPVASSSVVVGAGLVWVAMPDHDAVAVVDPVAREVVRHLAPCPAPRRLSFLGDDDGGGLLAVTCEERGPAVVVYAVDAQGGTTEQRRVTLSGSGRSPFGVVLQPGSFAVTARERATDDGLLLVYSLGRGPDAELRLGRDLRGVAAHPGGLLVTRHRSPDAHGELWRVDPDLTTHRHTLARDPGPDSDTNARGVPTYLQAVAVRPDGRVAVVAGQKANVERGLLRDGEPLTQETTVRADLRAVALVADEGAPGAELGRLVLDNRDLISAVAFHPRGDWLYAVTSGSRTLEVIDAYSLRRTAVVHEVGIAPDGLAVAPDGAWAYVHGRWSRTLALVDLTTLTDLPSTVIDLVPGGVDPIPPDVLLGAQVFHTSVDPRMTRDGYVSCASCHLDGEDDGRVWDFLSRGEGLRDTISLRGMDERVGLPIHWSGNFDEVQDFEHDIRGPQGGRGFLSDADWALTGTTLGAPKAGRSLELDAMAAFVEGLGVLDVPWEVDVAEGAALFASEAVGCADCHPDGGSTSRWLEAGVPELLDVGTLGEGSGLRLGEALTGLDVPSLRGAWASPPYLHDGSAPTLRAVLTERNPLDRHGRTSHLTEGELDALERYLRAL